MKKTIAMIAVAAALITCLPVLAFGADDSPEARATVECAPAPVPDEPADDVTEQTASYHLMLFGTIRYIDEQGQLLTEEDGYPQEQVTFPSKLVGVQGDDIQSVLDPVIVDDGKEFTLVSFDLPGWTSHYQLPDGEYDFPCIRAFYVCDVVITPAADTPEDDDADEAAADEPQALSEDSQEVAAAVIAQTGDATGSIAAVMALVSIIAAIAAAASRTLDRVRK